MLRFLANLFLLLSVVIANSSLPGNTSNLTMTCCCCEQPGENLVLSSTIAMQNDCACCAEAPADQLPAKTSPVQVKLNKLDLQSNSLPVIAFRNQISIPALHDTRRPLHLASNQLYLKKRALLI